MIRYLVISVIQHMIRYLVISVTQSYDSLLNEAKGLYGLS